MLCFLCHQPRNQHPNSKEHLCNHCVADLPRNSNPCARCGVPLLQSVHTHSKPASDLPSYCEECLQSPPAFHHCTAPFLYRFPVDRVIAKMKYQNRPQYAPVLGQLFVEHIQSRPQLLIPIPMHPSKQRERGYNQANYLAKYLGNALKIPVAYELLQKPIATPAQHGLDAKTRRDNVMGSLTLNPKYRDKVKTLQHVALIDDVITTGATCREAAHCLAAENDELIIDVWAVARTP